MSLAPTPTNRRHSTHSVGRDPTAGIGDDDLDRARRRRRANYNLSAGYHAKLEPFNAPVDLLAALDKPLQVWGPKRSN